LPLNARLAAKVNRMVSLSGQLMADGTVGAAAWCHDLLGLGGPDAGYAWPASCLNNDGVPIQLRLTAGPRHTGTRIIGDPGADQVVPEARYRVSVAALQRMLGRCDAEDLGELCSITLSRLIPGDSCRRAAYKQGFVWIAGSPERAGIGLYVETAPLGAAGWEVVEDWLATILPVTEPMLASLAALRRLCVPASAGLEGSTPGNARAKIYFRFREEASLDATGIALFASPEMSDFLTLAMGTLGVDLDGFVMGVGFSVATGALMDAKIDLCGHCLTHDMAEWSRIVGAISGRFGLRRLDLEPIAKSGDFEVAFIGLGFATDNSKRLNVYLKHAARAAPPATEEIQDALTDAIRYLCAARRRDGSWLDFALPVGSSNQWVTAYTGLALAEAGGLAPFPEARAASRRGAAWLATARAYGAGWGYNAATGPDSDSTAIAIALFDQLGMGVADEDRRFLADRWRGDDGLATFDEPNAWGTGHWDVTPLGYLGLLPGDRRRLLGPFLTALKKNRLPNGFWRSYWWRNPYYATFTTLDVLRRLDIPEPVRPIETNPEAIRIDNPFDLACYIGIESLRDPADPRIPGHLRALLNWQGRDGSWVGAPNLRVTVNTCYAPWNDPVGAYYADTLGTITTATAVRVLTRVLAACS
jgi:hypothetical protein